MSTFLTRLIEEKDQLDERIDKLTQFQSSEAWEKIHVTQMTLLNIQVKAMETYSQVLAERLALLTAEQPQ